MNWFEQLLNKKYECKHKLLGPEGEFNFRVLNRILSWEKDGIYYEAGQRHAELIIGQLKLEESKSVVIPGAREEQTKPFEQEGELMNPQDASAYRMVAARLDYLAMGRPDIQYATQEIAKQMSRPNAHHWLLIKRMGRYLKKVPRLVQTFDWLTEITDITGYSDSDWAGDLLTRKSTSGGACMIASHTIKTWPSTQQIIALSTAEAELYALIKCACQCTGIISLAADFGVTLKATVMIDASAALGIAQRRGLGKLRHIDAQWLWIQERLHQGELKAQKIAGKENPADLMAKRLAAEEMAKHVECLGYEMRTDRSEKSLKINSLKANDRDEWKHDEQCLIRLHAQARSKLFSPFQVAGCPGMSQLTSTRITHGKYVDTGGSFMIKDNWTCRSTRWRDLNRLWIGRIALIPKKDFSEVSKLVHKQQALWRENLVDKDYGHEIRAQVLTRKWREILQQHSDQPRKRINAITAANTRHNKDSFRTLMIDRMNDHDDAVKCASASVVSCSNSSDQEQLATRRPAHECGATSDELLQVPREHHHGEMVGSLDPPLLRSSFLIPFGPN